MDLTPVDIVGKRCYHFIHAEDVEGIRHSHLDCKYLHFFVKIICYQIVPEPLFIFPDWKPTSCSCFFSLQNFIGGSTNLGFCISYFQVFL